ncbi:hypothetical protein ASE13_04995 [Sphingomonas sp. Root241]|nr:hypothetical protein ASE13_04995 [Sphingomonas sp. Root241]
MRFRRPFRRTDIARSAVALCFVAGAYFAAVSALTAASRDASPDAALRLSPNDSSALANKALTVTLNGINAKNVAAVERIAQRSLKGDPINPRPYFVMLAVREVQHRPKDVQRLSDLSLKLSPRETALQLWHVERSVANDDIAGALRHYDYVLRIHPELNSLLFERLVDALTEAPIRRELIPYVKARTPWVGDMLRFALTNKGDPIAMTALVNESGGLANFSDSATLGRLLLESLAGAGYVERARDFYLRTPKASPSLLQNPGLTDASVSGLTPIAWELRTDQEVFASFDKNESTGKPRIVVQAPSERSAVVARKLLFLRPGTYTIAMRIAPVDPASPGDVTVNPQVYCYAGQGEKQALGANNLVTPIASGKHGLVVGAACSAQVLELKATSGANQNAGPVTIEDIVLTRAG